MGHDDIKLLCFSWLILLSCRWTPTKRPYPANQGQVYRTLLHWRGPPLLINAKCTESNYTKPVSPIEKWGAPPANRAQVYRVLLHQTSITYWEMRRPSPAIWPQVYRDLLYKRGPPLLIDPRWRLFYYTRQAPC